MVRQAIVFDFDGVITDGIPLHDEAYQKVFVDAGTACEEFDIEAEAENLLQRFHSILYKLYLRKAKPAPVLEDFLGECEEQGISIAVASSTSSQILEAFLSKFNLLPYFESIVGGDMIDKGKPNPEMIETALERIGFSGEDAVAIDDSQAGITAANKLNMYTIAYTRYIEGELQGAEEYVSDFSEIDIEEMVKY